VLLWINSVTPQRLHDLPGCYSPYFTCPIGACSARLSNFDQHLMLGSSNIHFLSARNLKHDLAEGRLANSLGA
jgi:hypothetical protein